MAMLEQVACRPLLEPLHRKQCEGLAGCREDGCNHYPAVEAVKYLSRQESCAHAGQLSQRYHRQSISRRNQTHRGRQARRRNRYQTNGILGVARLVLERASSAAIVRQIADSTCLLRFGLAVLPVT